MPSTVLTSAIKKADDLIIVILLIIFIELIKTNNMKDLYASLENVTVALWLVVGEVKIFENKGPISNTEYESIIAPTSINIIKHIVLILYLVKI